MALQEQAMSSQESNAGLEEYARKAIDLAMRGCWVEAIAANRALLELSPEDVEAHNRLGRALMKMGEYTAAKEAYGQALELDPYNRIAKKNLKRLSQLGELAPKDDHHKVVADIFVEETNKARVVRLVNLGPEEVVARMAPGEEVSLQVEGQSLIANNEHNEYLGEVEPKYGLRLGKLITGGNRYIAAISSLGENEVKILVREVYQHPNQAGRVSFPLREKERFRPYVRESLLRERLEEEELAQEIEEMAEIEGFAESES